MRTVCPSCRTAFHVSPAQLRVRAGRVRCGQCASAFNAVDHLFDDDPLPPRPAVSDPPCILPVNDGAPVSDAVRQTVAAAAAEPTATPDAAGTVPAPETSPVEEATAAERPPAADDGPAISASPECEPAAPLADSAQSPSHREPVDELPGNRTVADPATAADRSRTTATASAEKPVADETRASTDYRRRVNGSNEAAVSIIARQGSRRPYILAALLLALTLCGQLLFHFRTPLAIALPGLWPSLAALSEMLGTDMPLTRQIEQISIESSDLQVESNQKRGLILQATLRNRADYPQAYPALELTLTDVNDAILVKRVFLPDEYLSSPTSGSSAFPAHADLDVRLWLTASEVDSAGYRLYVFYP